MPQDILNRQNFHILFIKKSGTGMPQRMGRYPKTPVDLRRLGQFFEIILDGANGDSVAL